MTMKRYLLLFAILGYASWALAQEEKEDFKTQKPAEEVGQDNVKAEGEAHAVLTFSAVSEVTPSGEVEHRRETEFNPRVQGLVRGFGKRGFAGGFASVLVSGAESEIVVGPAFRFRYRKTYGETGIGPGICTFARSPIPLCGTWFMLLEHDLGKAKLEFFGAATCAKEAFAYEAKIMLYPRPWIGIGMMAQNEGLIGPRINLCYRGCYFLAAGGINAEAGSPSCLFGLGFFH